MGCILHFTYFCLYIYTLLLIYKPSGYLATTVSISNNITGIIGSNDIPLTCSFINEAVKQITKVQLFAKNKTNEFDYENPIAIFKPDKPTQLILSGYYLIGRVTLTNITNISNNATLTFHVLKCADERDYMCKCEYDNNLGATLTPEKSPTTSISIQVTPSKPDQISGIIVSSTKTETREYTSLKYNTSMSTEHNDILSFRTSPVDIVTTTNKQPTEKLPFVFREGDTVMFTCAGNIGSPPGKLIWQKSFPQRKKPITYSNETTDVEKIPGECSFKGTSNLTVTIYAEDIEAKIRCFEESLVNVPGMYLETLPLDVHFQVNHVAINKQPNQKQYDTRTDNITLICNGNGNPQPTYTWFKEEENNTILSNQSSYVIENVIRNNSGVYICEVYNVLDDKVYRKSNSVEIYIVHVDELPSSPDLIKKSFIEIVVTGICAVLVIVTCVVVIKVYCSRQKRKIKVESCSRKCSFDGITYSPEYASVILPQRNTLAVEKGNTLVGTNGMDDSKNKPKQEDLIKTMDLIPSLQTTSFHTPEYAVPSDALQAGNGTCKIPLGMTSFKDYDNI